MKAAGLKGFSTHKLRHTAATLMYQTGNVDILTLKQLLGHNVIKQAPRCLLDAYWNKMNYK